VNIYEHSDAQVDLYSYAMILFECGSQLRPYEVLPIYAWHCIAMSVTVRLSGCFAKKSPSRTGKMDQNGSKWIKMDIDT